MSTNTEGNIDNKAETLDELAESSRQDKMADDAPPPSNKNQSVEPCRTPIERNVLAHFFFIFAASFILGVIFLHSSLRFWSWQVNEINEYGVYETNYDPPSEAFRNQQNSEQYRHKMQNFGDNVVTILLSPNMTLLLKR